jgi:selenocysteine lyase/cysteine desulfurase
MDHSFFEETESIRKHFPIFAHRPEITFLDNASTTQKLQSVIEEASLFYSHNNTNVGRSLCDLDRAAYTQVEKVRAQVHELIHCNSPQEIYFTAGASHSMRTVTEILVHEYLEDGDEVLVCPEDHNSFVSPWYTYKEKYATLGKKINIVEFTVQNDGQIDWGALIKKISHKTRIINLTHIHNVYGRCRKN